MYKTKIALTTRDILEKEFKIDTRGYRLKEVDKFLDTVINDYQVFSKEIERLETLVEELQEENLKLKRDLRNARLNIEIASEFDKEITNVDILKRVSQLEKLVYNSKDNDKY